MRPRAGLVLLAALAGAPGAPAQTQAQRFDASYARLEAARDAGERADAAAMASRDFLRLPAGAERDARLSAGLWATFLTGRHELVVQLAGEARAQGREDDAVVELHLRALAHGKDPAALRSSLEAALRTRPGAAARALLAEQRAVLEIADRALRRGDRSAGRFLMQQLAALEPVDALRLGNFALCLRHLGELDASCAAYERAVALAPLDAQLVNDLGLCLRAAGRTAAARAAFERSLDLDAAVPGGVRGMGPAITNLVHHAALHPGADHDPLPAAWRALAARPDSTMLRRLTLDVHLDRSVVRSRR